MRRALAATLLAACGGVDPLPPEAERVEVTLEILHAGLDGPSTFPAERLDGLAESLAQSPADLICLQGIWRPEDRASLAAALTSAFPYSLELATADSTLVDDPAAADGSLPEQPTDPACNAADEVKAGTVLLCLQNGCNEPGGPAGAMVGPFCLTPGYECGDLLEDLVSETDPHQRCRACVLSHAIAGSSLDAIRDRCRNRPGTPLAHEGQHGMMLLSRLPISDPSIHVLPGESVRRAVLSATLATGQGSLDVHCATLGPVELGLPGDLSTSEAYPGPYGDPQGGWRVEHDLQLDKLLAHVHARSADRPAVVLGNFGASEGVAIDGEVVVAASSPSSVERLLAAYDEAVPEDGAASCTLCQHNHMLPMDTTPSWLNRIYLSGLPGAEVRDSSRVYLGNVVQVAPRNWSPFITRVPLALQYGLRSTVSYELP